MDNRKQLTNWCFTLNNPTPDDKYPDESLYKYLVVGREVSPSGTPHWQGFISFKKVIRLSALKKIMPRAHWEGMRGTPKEASDYCKEDGDYDEYGTLPETGGESTKRKWEEAKKLAIAGDLESIQPSIYIPYYNTLKRIKSDHAQKVLPIDVLDNEWHYGPTGTGKSRTVREKYPDAFIKDANRWWDGYNNEEVVIVEDVDKYDVKLGRYIKLWADHYAFPADSKHQGKIDIRPKKIIITSNYSPEEIWGDEKTYGPINRRFKLVEYET